MKILLDECVTNDLRSLLAGHEVFTVGFLGWKGTANGALLRLAAGNGFGVLVTTDQAIKDQHNESCLILPIVILTASSNHIRSLLPLIPTLLALLQTPLHRQFYVVP